MENSVPSGVGHSLAVTCLRSELAQRAALQGRLSREALALALDFASCNRTQLASLQFGSTKKARAGRHIRLDRDRRGPEPAPDHAPIRCTPEHFQALTQIALAEKMTQSSIEACVHIEQALAAAAKVGAKTQAKEADPAAANGGATVRQNGGGPKLPGKSA